jgi:hypothetical protein
VPRALVQGQHQPAVLGVGQGGRRHLAQPFRRRVSSAGSVRGIVAGRGPVLEALAGTGGVFGVTDVLVHGSLQTKTNFLLKSAPEP